MTSNHRMSHQRYNTCTIVKKMEVKSAPAKIAKVQRAPAKIIKDQSAPAKNAKYQRINPLLEQLDI